MIKGLKSLLRPIYLPILHKLKFVKQNRNFKTNGNEVLLKAKQALDEAGIQFWLDFGTLLGIYRDGKLISHDTDIDIAMFLSDYSEDVITTLEKHGFTYERKLVVDDGKYALEQAFSFLNVKMDIFYYTRKGDKCISHLFPLNDKKEYVVRELYTTYTGFRKIEFLNEEFDIPKDTELRLVETYGKDYKIPIKNWYTPDDALNSKIISKECKEIKYG